MISINNVSKQFSNTLILNNCSLELNKGDRVAIIGGNGAGKTTLLRSLLGHYTHQGSIKIFGMDPRDEREKILQLVGFVPQLPPPIQMTLNELVNFSVKITDNLKKQMIFDVAEQLKLDIHSNLLKPFFKLSGGMKQKMLIALALSKNPKLLVLDEPAANLDPYGRDIFFERLNDVSADTIIVLTSHRIKEVEFLVNRVVEMDCGKIINDQILTKENL